MVQSESPLFQGENLMGQWHDWSEQKRHEGTVIEVTQFYFNFGTLSVTYIVAQQVEVIVNLTRATGT